MPPYIPKDESGIKGHQQTLLDNPEECLRVVLECLKMPGRFSPSQVLRPTSYGKWVGGPMSLKQGNFSFRARTAQNWLRMGKYGTYLECNTSQEAPKHCPTLDSPTQCFASAHFRSPPVRLQFASDFAAPPISLRLHIPSLISLQH